MTPSVVSFVVGNTYRSIAPDNAKLDRTRKHRRIHDWQVYVDVVGDGADVLDRVTFDMGSSFSPQLYTCHCPVQQQNGAWRFQSRQQSYGAIICGITLHGRGGSKMTVSHRIRLTNFREKTTRKFVESNYQKRLGPVPLPSGAQFGIELELSFASSETPRRVAGYLKQASGIHIQALTENYSEARSNHEDWKLMMDSSIACHVNRPDCNAVELVSPILRGDRGLDACCSVLSGLKQGRLADSVKVNKSMGFHVHVNVGRISPKNLRKICQNFIKFEDVMDAIMPPSRRNENPYCQSNKMAIPGHTNKARHFHLAKCKSIADLCDAMNPGQDRYYKLNLQNLRTERQQTIEFRQHSGTTSREKVVNWIRFCVALVHNSIRLAQPSPFADSRTVDEELDMMIQYVIKDRYLGVLYKDRRAKMAEAQEGSCCHGCAGVGACARAEKRIRI